MTFKDFLADPIGIIKDTWRDWKDQRETNQVFAAIQGHIRTTFDKYQQQQAAEQERATHLIYGININNRKGQLEMGDLIELPEGADWNRSTGTFDKLGSKTAEVDPQQFADLIQERFGASELTPDQKAKALTTLDNAAVYLHQADPTNRLDRSPTINSIAAEWATLGITMKQAKFMIDRTIDHTGRQTEVC